MAWHDLNWKVQKSFHKKAIRHQIQNATIVIPQGKHIEVCTAIYAYLETIFRNLNGKWPSSIKFQTLTSNFGVFSIDFCGKKYISHEYNESILLQPVQNTVFFFLLSSIRTAMFEVPYNNQTPNNKQQQLHLLKDLKLNN